MALLAKLRFRGPLHVGSSTVGEEDTYDYVPSDTLFSGLCHAYLALFGREALEALLRRFSEDPPFLVSSAFPFFADTLFLPFPRIPPPPRAEEAARGTKKRLKATTWLSLEDFSRLLRGEDLGDGGEIHHMLPRKELLPRVALDRVSNGSSIYYVRRAVFPEEGGLWVLLDVRDDTLKSGLVGALRLLGDTGLGGERTMGCGQFEPQLENPPETLAGHLGGTRPYVALSRVSPDPKDSGSAERYDLVESKGWMLSPTGVQRKRKSAWFFAEGSSFKEPLRGRLLDVTPEYGPGHRVYRYGFGIYVGSTS